VPVANQDWLLQILNGTQWARQDPFAAIQQELQPDGDPRMLCSSVLRDGRLADVAGQTQCRFGCPKQREGPGRKRVRLPRMQEGAVDAVLFVRVDPRRRSRRGNLTRDPSRRRCTASCRDRGDTALPPAWSNCIVRADPDIARVRAVSARRASTRPSKRGLAQD
jgi:hypothetical protein